MNREYINKIKHDYENLLNSNEETVKGVIIYDLLENLGYPKLWFACEESNSLMRDSRKDICIYVNRDKSKTPFFIEVKRKDDKLDDKSIDQLSKYLNQNGVDWGMLTNGYRYLLINNTTLSKIPSVNRIVIDISLKNLQKFERDIKYFMYDSLFKNSQTKYLILPPLYNYFNKHLESTIKNINCVLSEYSRYLASIFTQYDETNIKPYTFMQFLFSKTQEDSYSKCTFENHYRYIKSACTLFKEKGYLKDNYFSNSSEEDFLSHFVFKESKFNDNTYPITNDEINKLLEYFETHTRESERNKLMVLLTLYCALDLDELQNLKRDYFLPEKMLLKFPDGRQIKLTESLNYLVFNHIKKTQKDKIHCEYMFYSKYGKEYDKISRANINAIISQNFNKLGITKERQKVLIPSFIRSSVIKRMFDSGFSIEDIICLTGLSLTGIGQYITFEDILKRHTIKKIVSHHPYKNFFT